MTYSPYIAWTKPPGVASLGDIVRALRRGAAEALPAGVSIILDEIGSRRVAGLASTEVWASRGLEYAMDGLAEVACMAAALSRDHCSPVISCSRNELKGCCGCNGHICGEQPSFQLSGMPVPLW